MKASIGLPFFRRYQGREEGRAMKRFAKLKNGSTMIAWKGNYVLCHWTGWHGEEKDEFVTWFVDSDGECNWGNYYPGTPKGLSLAVKDLLGRLTMSGVERNDKG